MSYETLLYNKEDGIAVITINRPTRMNALNKKLLDVELPDAVASAENDPEVRCMLFTGAKRADGRPVFSVGGDIKEIREIGFFQMLGQENIFDRAEAIFDWSQPLHSSEQVFERIEVSRKPSIAAIDGPCTAGGIELALSCDIRIVSETAEVSDLHVKNMGQIGGGGATPRLARAVGPAMAKLMAWTGKVYNGKDAVTVGFAQECYPPDKYLDEAKKLAKNIASMKPEAVRTAKFTINVAMDTDLRQALRFSYLCAFAPHYRVVPPEQPGQNFADRNK
ncbi:MAG: enoyl-CoA hydratase/isomerase family protein [Vicinamibacterales bacterium]|nr:enoyl-CoA hydratase/isomerase family protein [Vicinamibacterales bacterium]